MSRNTIIVDKRDCEMTDGEGDEEKNWQGHSIGLPTDA